MIRAACSARSAARDSGTSLRNSCSIWRSVFAVAMRSQRIAAEVGLEADPEYGRAERRKACRNQREPIAVSAHKVGAERQPDERRDRHESVAANSTMPICPSRWSSRSICLAFRS